MSSVSGMFHMRHLHCKPKELLGGTSRLTGLYALLTGCHSEPRLITAVQMHSCQRYTVPRNNCFSRRLPPSRSFQSDLSTPPSSCSLMHLMLLSYRSLCSCAPPPCWGPFRPVPLIFLTGDPSPVSWSHPFILFELSKQPSLFLKPL